MKLQRYEPHTYGSLLGESRILFEASDPGEWVKADEALAEIAALRKVLKCFDMRNSWLEIHLSMGERNEYEKLIIQGRLG
jgi:hypothetical protein